MLDFILKVIGREYQAFRSKPRHMEISLGATSNPVESPHQIVHSTMHMLPYRELTTRKGTVRIPICEDADKVIDKLNLFNPLESPYQMVHSAMHMRISPVDQMIMYANNRQKKEKKLGAPTEKACLTDVMFDSIFTDELHKYTEEEDKNDV